MTNEGGSGNKDNYVYIWKGERESDKTGRSAEERNEWREGGRGEGRRGGMREGGNYTATIRGMKPGRLTTCNTRGKTEEGTV